jgi:hypothetical protein
MVTSIQPVVAIIEELIDQAVGALAVRMEGSA